MSVQMYRYTAIVNNQTRSVIFGADPDAWGGYLTHADARLLIDNERKMHDTWYGPEPTDEDYEAEHENATLEVYVPGHFVPAPNAPDGAE